MLSSCLRETEQTPLGYLVYVNAFEESPSVSYFFDGRYATTIPYRSFGDSYVLVGERVMVITDPITNASILDTVVRFEDQQFYHSFLYGTRNEPQIMVAEYKPLAELDNQAAVRFLHLANGIEEVDVEFVKDSQVVRKYEDRTQESKESAEKHSLYNPIETGTYTIRVLDSEGEQVAIRENVVLSDKGHYTYTLVGRANSDLRPLYIGEIR